MTRSLTQPDRLAARLGGPAGRSNTQAAGSDGRTADRTASRMAGPVSPRLRWLSRSDAYIAKVRHPGLPGVVGPGNRGRSMGRGRV